MKKGRAVCLLAALGAALAVGAQAQVMAHKHHEEPAGERLKPEEIPPLQARLVAQYPLERQVIDHTLKGLRDKPITRKAFGEFEKYIDIENQGKQLLRPYTGDLTNVPRGRFKGVFQAAIAKMPRTERKQLQALREQLKGLMTVLMGTEFANPIMEADPFAKRLMPDYKQHDQDWKTSQPNDPFPHRDSAETALEDGDARAALSDAKRAAELDANDSKARSLIAAANYDLKNFKEAGDAAREALRIDPDDPVALTVLRLAHQASFTAPRGEGLERWDTGAGSPGPLGNFGGYRPPPARLGGFTTPRHSLQAAEFTRQAERFMSLGDNALAIANASRAIELDPRSADAYGKRALAEARAGRHPEALDDAAASLAIDARNLAGLNSRVSALNRMGRYKDALAAADAALSVDPRNAYAHYMRAMALDGLRDRPGMLDELGQAAALDSRYEAAYAMARAAPDEKDLAFLFPEEGLSAAKALLAAQGPSAPRAFWNSLWGWPSVVGMALILFGVLHFLIAPLTAGRRWAARRSPAVDANPTRASLPTPLPFALAGVAGTILSGQYRRLGQIGSSVHGAVYEGLDLSLDRRVAIRKLRADMRAVDRQRLLGPARAAAALHHGGVAALYGVFEEGETLYLVAEFAPGRTLRDILAAKGPLSSQEALPLFRLVAAALDYAHGKQVVHGAIRASNIMLDAEGRPKIVDFGLDRGPGDAVADLQAFAACLREAIAGLPPSQLDAVDAVLARSCGEFASATQVVELVEAGLRSASEDRH